MNKILRRQLIKAGALAVVIPTVPFMAFASFSTSTTEEADPWLGLKVGVATYTLRELPIEEAIQGVKRVGLKYVSIKNVKNHIDLSHSSEERKRRAQMFRDAGLIPLSVGNVSMRTGESDIRKAFEFARDIGVQTIVCAPATMRFPSSTRWSRNSTSKSRFTITDQKTKVFFRPRSTLCGPSRNLTNASAFASM